MKKLMQFCFVILASVLSALDCVNFSFNALDRIEEDKLSLVIEKPEDEDNRDFLAKIEAAIEPLGVDIMFRYIDTADGKNTYNYYKTNHTADFLNVSTSTGSILVSQGECVSTKEQDGFTTSRLYVSSLMQDISLFSWEQAERYDLSSGTYFVRMEHRAKVVEAIRSLGYSVSVASSTYISGQYSVLLFGFVPAFMLIASMVFYVLSNGKKNVLKKMDGYSTSNIVLDELAQIAPVFMLSFLAVEAVTLGIAFILYHNALLPFFIFSLKNVFMLAGTVVIGIILWLLLIARQKSATHIKGRVPRRGIYVTTILAKCVFAAFIVFFLSIALRNVAIAYHTAQTAQFLSEKVDGYVTVPMNTNNSSASGLRDNYKAFYMATVDRYNGILVDSSNYSYDLTSGSTMAEDYGQDSIVVNRNYLAFNPIYNTAGEVIASIDLPNDCFNVLIPEIKLEEEQRYREQIKQGYGMESNFISYDSSASRVYSYNADTGTGAYGSLDAPVIMVVTDEALEGIFIQSYCSKGEYFLKIPSENPYAELLPILQETGIAAVTLSTPTVASTFAETINHQKFMLVLYGAQSTVLLLGLFCLILFSANLYCENYRHKIACCLIEGYSLLICIKSHLVVTVLYYGAVIFALRFLSAAMHVSLNYFLLLAMFICELIVTAAVSQKYTKQNLYQIVKGAE